MVPGSPASLLARGLAGVRQRHKRTSAQLDELDAPARVITIGPRPANLDGVDTVVVTTGLGPTTPSSSRPGARADGGAPGHHAGRAHGRPQGVAISGTHGKTTTTSMLARCCARLGADPSYVIGGRSGRDRHQRPHAARATCSWPRRTRATARSSCCRPGRGDRHQHRSRPPGLLREPGRGRGGLRGVRGPDQPRRAARRVLRRPRARGTGQGRGRAPGPGAHLRRVARRRLPGDRRAAARLATAA